MFLIQAQFFFVFNVKKKSRKEKNFPRLELSFNSSRMAMDSMLIDGHLRVDDNKMDIGWWLSSSR